MTTLRDDMPSFLYCRREAYRLLGDAEDWLRSDWSDEPNEEQIDALGDAFEAIARAKRHLDQASARR
jgi:hypothetical protein